jgi:hypothetical protein
MMVVAVSGWVVLAGCSVRHRVYPVDASLPKNVRGVLYSLPETMITVEVPVTRTVVAKTALWEGARELLGLSESEIGVFYKVGTPKVGTRSRPDPDARFIVEIAGGTFEERSLQLELTEAGLLTTADSKAEDKSVDFAVKTLEIAAGLAARVAFAGEAPVASKTRTAESVAEEIKTLRNARRKLASGDLLIGTLPADTLERMFKELDILEESLLGELRVVRVSIWNARAEVRLTRADFCGTSTSTDRTLFSIPAGFKQSPEGLLPIGDSNHRVRDPGVKPSDNKLVEIPPEFEYWPGPDTAWVPITVSLSLEVVSLPQGDGSAPVSPGTASGFFYRSPVPVTVAVRKGTTTLSNDRPLVAQLGPILTLPSSPGGKASEYRFAVFPETGGLKKLFVTSTAQGTAPVEGVGRAAAQLVEAQRAADNELANLERQQKVLEAKKKIRDLQKELGAEQ